MSLRERVNLTKAKPQSVNNCTCDWVSMITHADVTPPPPPPLQQRTKLS